MTGASANNETWRTEKDALGEVQAPALTIYGARRPSAPASISSSGSSGIAGGGRSSERSAY